MGAPKLAVEPKPTVEGDIPGPPGIYLFVLNGGFGMFLLYILFCGCFPTNETFD